MRALRLCHPVQVLFCDPVVPACVQPELDPAVVNFEDGLGPSLRRDALCNSWTMF